MSPVQCHLICFKIHSCSGLKDTWRAPSVPSCLSYVPSVPSLPSVPSCLVRRDDFVDLFPSHFCKFSSDSESLKVEGQSSQDFKSPSKPHSIVYVSVHVPYGCHALSFSCSDLGFGQSDGVCPIALPSFHSKGGGNGRPLQLRQGHQHCPWMSPLHVKSSTA